MRRAWPPRVAVAARAATFVTDSVANRQAAQQTPTPGGTITASTVGGLGNQLFLVAGLLATARRNGLRPYLERIPVSDSCEAPRPTYWTSLLADLDVPPTVEATGSPTPPRVASDIQVIPEVRPTAGPVVGLNPTGHYRMVGFFQSDRYFDDAAMDIRLLFSQQQCLAAATKRFNLLVPPLASSSSADPQTNKQVVALHIRRGDYLRMRDVFEILDHDTYYCSALETLYGRQLSRFVAEGHVDRAIHAPIRVLVFCEEAVYGRTFAGMLESKYPGLSAVAVGHPQHDPSMAVARAETTAPASMAAPGTEGRDLFTGVPLDVQELLMMSLCDDVIMANSSFSWWGAYLNSQPGSRVVAPSRWFVKDPFPTMPQLYCDGWIIR